MHLPTLTASWDLLKLPDSLAGESSTAASSLTSRFDTGLDNQRLFTEWPWSQLQDLISDIASDYPPLSVWIDDDIPPNIIANPFIRKGRLCTCSGPLDQPNKEAKGNSFMDDLKVICRCTTSHSHTTIMRDDEKSKVHLPRRGNLWSSAHNTSCSKQVTCQPCLSFIIFKRPWSWPSAAWEIFPSPASFIIVSSSKSSSFSIKSQPKPGKPEQWPPLETF